MEQKKPCGSCPPLEMGNKEFAAAVLSAFRKARTKHFDECLKNGWEKQFNETLRRNAASITLSMNIDAVCEALVLNTRVKTMLLWERNYLKVLKGEEKMKPYTELVLGTLSLDTDWKEVLQ